jgi:hypothetical protein
VLLAARPQLSHRGDSPIVRRRTPLQLRYHTHGGLTPAAPDHDARYARRIRFPLPVRCHTHGGFTPAALCGGAFVHRKNRFFAGKRSHCNTRGGRKPPVENITPLHIATADQRRYACLQPGAAGVSQPWFRKRAGNGNTAIVAQGRPADRPYTNAVAVTLPHPRRAHARRSLWTCVCASQKSFFRRQTFATHTRAGGVSPPWLRDRDCNDVHQPIGDSLPRLCGIALASAFPHTTAGLRPPFFVDVRLCIAKIVFSPANVRNAYKSGGRKPPVVTRP